jgi:hypothetical protein
MADRAALGILALTAGCGPRFDLVARSPELAEDLTFDQLRTRFDNDGCGGPAIVLEQKLDDVFLSCAIVVEGAALHAADAADVTDGHCVLGVADRASGEASVTSGRLVVREARGAQLLLDGDVAWRSSNGLSTYGLSGQQWVTVPDEPARILCSD